MKPKVLHATTITAAAAVPVPAAASVPKHDGWSRNSPGPYLFAGVALMFAMVVVALILLACSYIQSSDSASDTSHEKPHKHDHVLRPEMEPRMVVIMAGDTVPTYLAKPVSATAAVPRSEEQDELSS